MSVTSGKPSEDNWGMYDIVVNSVPGVISILIFLFLLPIDVLDTRNLLYQANSLLYSLTSAIIFAILGYVVSILLSSFLPTLPHPIWVYFYKMPFMPDPSPRLELSERYRYSEAAEKLFGCNRFESIGKGREMSQRYLEFKGMKRIHHYNNLDSVFTQLWEVATYASLLVFLFGSPSLSTVQIQIGDLNLSPGNLLLIGAIFSLVSRYIVSNLSDLEVHPYIIETFRSVYYYLPLLYVSNWLLSINFTSVIGLSRVPLNYGFFIGEGIVPILFSLSLIFFKTKREYEEKLASEIFRTLYVVANAEDDI